MAENKIPILTEVYKPKEAKSPQPSTVEATEELVTKVISQVKPRLEAEITDFVLDELKVEINKARNEIIASTKDFVDRTKADLKTELPSMYQESVKLAEVNLTEKFSDMHVEASTKFDASIAEITGAAIHSADADINERVVQSFENNMQEFQPVALAKSQALLEAQLEKINQEAQQNLTQQLQSFQEQVIEQHKLDLSNALESVQQSIKATAEEAMQNDLRALQEQMLATHQKQLHESLDGFLQIQGEAAEKELLQKVQEHQSTLHADYQQKLSEEMAAALETIQQRVEESTVEQTDVMFTQVGTIQQETFVKLRQEFNDEKTAILNEATEEIKGAFFEQMTEQSEEVREQFLAKVNGEMPDVQAVLQESVSSILSNAIPDLEDRLKEQLTKELQDLLLTVKFVLPDR